MNNRFTIIVIAMVVGFAGIFWFTKKKNEPTTKGSNVQPTNHIKGDAKTTVNLTEYGDFECPACYQYEPLVRSVYEKYKSDITFQFRNFPLTQIHQHALAGHRAAEAADKQGKFWEMHDILFEHAHQKNQEGKVSDIEWTTTNNPQTYFEQYATQLQLDLTKFKADINSSEVNDLINADRTVGEQLGFNSTPSFTINGKAIKNPTDVDGFSKLLDEAIAAAKAKK